MKKIVTFFLAVVILVGLMSCATTKSGVTQSSDKIKLKDPKGDDKGTGVYTYPTDPVYAPGSFDLLSCDVTDKGEEIEFKVKFNAPVSFSWGDAWDVQQIQIYLDMDHKKGSGRTKTLPGTQVVIDEESAWEKVVFIDPHSVAKINGEIGMKAKEMAKDIILPHKIKPIGKTIKAIVKKSDLGISGTTDLSKWGYGVMMLSATGFPGDWCVLMRRVNEYNGQHRFGGGADGAGDPNVMDMIVGDGNGSKDEKELQYNILKNYKSSMDPEETEDDKLAKVKFVYPGK